jgi:hypothetical protein
MEPLAAMISLSMQPHAVDMEIVEAVEVLDSAEAAAVAGATMMEEDVAMGHNPTILEEGIILRTTVVEVAIPHMADSTRIVKVGEDMVKEELLA